jgi:acyl dehydratase
MSGLYFEEFSVGQKIVTVGRTLSESNIFDFAGLTGDYNQIHTDAEFARATPFGQRIVHGLLGLSIGIGLLMRTGMLEGTVLVFREINEWKFVKPIFIGDTLHAQLEVADLKAFPRLGAGSVTALVQVLNQSGEVCQKGSLNLLVMSKPA